MIRTTFSYAVTIGICLLLISCGGGGGGEPTGDVPVSVSLPQNINSNEQQELALQATGFPTGGSYLWTQIAGPIITDFPLETAEINFTTPLVKSEQTIGLRVEYTANNGQIATAETHLLILPVNNAPIAIAQLASPDVSFFAPGQTVILDGRNSSDNDGSIVAYEWQQISGPEAENLNNNNHIEFHLITPEVEQLTELSFHLQVTDDEQSTAGFDVSVTVDPNVNTTQVDAGADQIINEQQTVTLTAVGSPIDGSYLWTQSAGSIIPGFPSNEASVSFMAPSIKTQQLLEFRVDYTAPNGELIQDFVSITVQPINQNPVAVINTIEPNNFPAEPSQIVTLDATNSFDPDADGLIENYDWEQLSGPETLETVLTDNQQKLSFRTPVSTNDHSYGIRLSVTDDEQGVGTFDIEITVKGANVAIHAEAGNDQQVKEFTTVWLDGQESFSVVSVVDCRWRQISGPEIIINGPNSCLSEFIAPNVDTDSELIFELIASNSSADLATDLVKINITPLNLGTLPDTGVTRCYDNNVEIPCNNLVFPRQDAESGRDSIALFLDKSGTGDVGFNLTKLDANGDELPNNSSEYHCLRDNHTGLIWELKQDSINVPPLTDLQDRNNRYTWHYPDGSTGGNEGEKGEALTTCPSTEDCGLSHYIDEVNTITYCGGANWRLPTVIELQSIITFAESEVIGVLDGTLFGDLPDRNLREDLYFWTSETSADGGGSELAWVINFENGNDNALPKIEAAFVRLVRTSGE